MSPRSRRHGVPPPAFLGVLVAMLLALGLAGTATAGNVMSAQDVVVNVTAGANDPVSGATVVARDDLTGRVMSNATTTGHLGYAAIRLRPGASTRRITITATGGRSQAVGPLSAADVMSATAQRGVLAKEITVNVNPGSTVLAEYLDERPGASVAAAERAVGRRLRLPKGTDVAESARFSRLRFSGEDFIDAARKQGGVADYAEWAAERIGAGSAVRSFAAPRPADELPLRGPRPLPRAGAGLRRENAIGGAAFSVAWTLAKPLVELGAKKAYCLLGIKDLCSDDATPDRGGLTEEEVEQLKSIERGISNLSAQMQTAQQALSAIDVQVAALGAQVAILQYGAEMNAVQAILSNVSAAAAFRAAGEPVPSGLARALTNALAARYGINAGCTNWPALIGALPAAVVRDGSGLRYPLADCQILARGTAVKDGLLQFAQRSEAAASTILMAGTTQARVDRAGEYWLGELARNVLATNMASEYALHGGTSTRTAEVVDATAGLFEEVVERIEIDATGAYFGARIPANQVLVMGASTGTVYGIGKYAADPGACRGNVPWNTVWSRTTDRVRSSWVRERPDGRDPGDFAYAPEGYTPKGDRTGGTPAACTAAQVMEPPPPVPGASDALAWASPDALPAENQPAVLAALRRAALCHMKDRVTNLTTLRGPSGVAAGGLCDAYPIGIPDAPFLSWSGRDSSGNSTNKTHQGVLPNLQLSLKASACVPWTIGFATHDRWTWGYEIDSDGRPTGITSPNPTPEYLAASATGMQCPVVDLTPRAQQRTGWNCVSANPAGRITYQGYRAASATTVPVTASLEALNNRTLGGYCPNLGGTPPPPGAENASHFTGDKIICSPGLAVFSRRAIEDIGWIRLDAGGDSDTTVIRAHSDSPCVGSRDFRSTDSAYDFPPVWPLQRQIDALTTFTAFDGGRVTQSAAIPGYKASNWTYNNEVAGDFVVGPLYASPAVGAYVPGTSPGAPAATAPPRVTGVGVPDAVRDLSLCGSECTGDTTSIRVDWRAPASSGGVRILAYEVVATTRGSGPAGRTALTRPCPAPKALAMQCVIRGLNLAQDWDVTVRARNALGKGAASIITFTAGPDRPTLRPMFQALEVRWGPPKSWDLVSGAGGLQGALVSQSYRATASPGGRTCTADGFSSTRCIITGLTPGTAYTVKVVLVGKYYWGSMMTRDDAASLPSAPAIPLSTASRPDAPEIDSAVPSAGRINVTWREPKSDGASPIAGYTVMADPGGATCITTGALSCSIDGLAPAAEYAVTVTAANGVGVGPRSSPFRRRTPPAQPGPPRTPLAQASPGTIDVSWVAPDFDGGEGITGYTATASPGGAQCTTDGATSCTISGVPNGTEYQVTVAATNAVGTGRASVPAAARTPDLTAPGAPRSVELTALPGRIEVAWSAPESDGGSLVTGYIATASPGGATCTTTGATLCTITGLDDGTAYRVAVAAINVIGTGEPSDSGEAVTPRRNEGGAAPVVDDLPLQATSIPGTAESGLPVGAPVAGRAPDITGLALRPRTLVPGLGGRIAYTLSEPADVTITIARVGGRDRASRVVHRIPAGRPGALAGDTRIRVLYSFASARRKKPGAWTLTIEARDAQGGVATKAIPIRVRT